MTAQQQIDTLKGEVRYQLQQIPDEGNPSGIGDFATPKEAQQHIGGEILQKIQDGFLFGSDPRASEFPSAVYIHRTTIEQRPVEVVEGHRYQILARSAWDVLTPEAQNALLVTDAQENGKGDEFPIEWLPENEQEAERTRRAKLVAPPTSPAIP